MSQTILPFSDKPFLDKSGIQLPDLSPKTQHVTFELLQKNHKNFDMFINEQRFHNHLVHHLLAAYSLGASEQHLNEIYKLHTTMLSLKPRKPKQITITKENWTEFLGQYDLWGDYVDFFDKVVKEEGMEKAVNEYAFHPLVFPRLFARIFHPVIHLGCGVEFQIPMVVSEALAKTAVHPFDFADILTGDYFSFKANEKQSAMDIILKISRNEKFNNCWKFATESTEKSCPTHLVIEKDLQFIDVKAEDVRNIAKHWTVLETEEGVQKAIQELYEACVLVYGATTIRPDTKKIYLDFFLMHLLTAVLLITAILPYISIDKRAMLLKGHFAGVVHQYISRGCPPFNLDFVRNYQPKNKPEEYGSWESLIQYSLEEKDPHLVKTMRALFKAEKTWNLSGKESLYFKIAQLTLDGYRNYYWSL